MNTHFPRRTPHRLFLYATFAAVLAACSVAPHYERPEAPIAAAYPVGEDTTGHTTMGEFVDPGWRAFFPDERLQALITASLEHNRDLQVAALNMQAALAEYDITAANALPNLGAGASFARARTPADQSPTGQAYVADAYTVGLNISSFELDFWGRIKSLKGAALAQYLSTAETRQAAQISLISQVAQTYLSEVSLEEQEELAQKTLDSRLNDNKLTMKRFEVGAVSQLDVSISNGLVESARIALASTTNQRHQAQHALTLLVGKPMDDADLPQAKRLTEQQIVTDLPAGLPASLLTHRPDIRAAEQQLLAANANIGAARAAFFPTISLTSGVGQASFDLKNLFQGVNRTWSFVPQLTVPIFDAGRNRANLNLAQVQKHIAIANYEKAIQTAFREVADALTTRAALDKQLQAQIGFLKAQEERVKLTGLRYKNGIDNAADMLNAERDLFSAQQTLIQTRQQRLANAINLYAALGGGLAE